MLIWPDAGAIFGWVYGRERNEWLVCFVNPVREGLSSRMPRRLLYRLSFFIAVAFQLVLNLLYRPAHRLPALALLRDKLPYSAYMGWLSNFGLRHTHHVVFDHLVAPTAFYIRREEFAGWFEQASLQNVTITWRNQNSWRGLGYLPK